MIIFRYRWHVGSVAWIIHRITGIMLTLYIFAHLYVLSHIRDPKEFTRLMEMTHSPLVKLLEVGLMGVVAAHALNGVRLTALELGAPTRLQKPMFWAAAVAVAVIVVIGAVVFLGAGGAA